MIFKRKRKEKSKRGRLLRKALLLALILLLGLLGVAAYLLLPGNEAQVADVSTGAGITFTGDLSCSYSEGAGSRDNPDASARIAGDLQAVGLTISEVTVQDELRQYMTCGEEVKPIYAPCASLNIALPIDSTDPTEGELGRHIAQVLDVLTVQDTCTPEMLTIRFENPRGDITWQMRYEFALEAYEDGARGEALYDPRARR